MFNYEELQNFIQDILDKFEDKIREEITLANRTSKEEIYKILDKYEIGYVKETNDNPYINVRTAKVLIVGNCNIKDKDIRGLCKSINFDYNRIDFLDFDNLKSYNFENLRYSKYSDVLFGGVSHKGGGIGDSTSIITFLENGEGFPNVIRCQDSNGLNLNKTTLKKGLLKTKLISLLI